MYIIKKRVISFYIMILIIVLVVFIRLTYLKVIANDDYLINALELWTRDAPIEARRGIIYDRNGKVIVGNKLTPTVVVIPKQVENKEEVAKKIGKILNCDYNKILKHLNKHVSVEIIKPEGRKITIEQATEIIKLNIDGVYIVADTSRDYAYNHYLAPVLGIVGIDNQGLTGLEYQYDSLLKGGSGAVKMYVDAHGNLIENLTDEYYKANAGFDLYLTIDLDIQMTIERIIDNAVAMYDPEEVIAIAANPKTMEIYAMASRPSFDPNNYQEYDSKLYNWNLPIFSTFEPGSTSKIITFSGGLEENIFKLDETFVDVGYRMVSGVRIKDWKAGGHGTETFLEVLQNSCNPGFMEIGLRLGKEKLIEYMKKFGYGEKTGIDLIGETTGLIFDPKNMGDLETATSAFGQGISTSAIQLVTAVSAAVNGGNLLKPTILKGLGISNTNEVIYQTTPILKRQVISTKTSKKVADALEHVVALGTGRSAYVENMRIGGKTGTAQIAENGHYLENQYILSFIGIAPMNDPQIVVYFAIKNAKNTIQYGGVTVGPMIKEAITSCFSILNIPKQSGGIPLDARYWIDKKSYLVENYIGLEKGKIIRNSKYNIEYVGEGEKVIAQIPEVGSTIVEGGTVLLYLD
ncbi:MAG: stage V sporulation protein D [Bacilli bacterium]|nr:stage V sporulation protein D [Bacilli bacterium]